MKRIITIFIALAMLSLMTGTSWAEEPATPELKLNDAITMALKNSNVIKRALIDIDKSEGSRDYLAQNTLAPTAGITGSPAVDSAWYSLLTADMNWQMSKKTYSIEEDKLVISACQKYWNVQKAISKAKNKELAVSRAKLTLHRTQAMVSLGMMPAEMSSGASPQAALISAETGLTQAKSDLTAAQNELNSSYDAFNQMVGLPVTARPLLTDDIEIEPLEVDSLDAAVNRVLDASPSIWKAEESVKIAQYARDSLWATGQYSPSSLRQAGLDQAQLDALTARDAVSLATRLLYYTVLNLEAGIQTAEKAVAGAEDALRVAKLQYELGMITRESLLRSEVSLAEAKQSLLELTTQYAYNKLAFQKPWAV